MRPIILLLLLSGCTHTFKAPEIRVNPYTTVMPAWMNWNKESGEYIRSGDWWYSEAKKRLSNPFILLCHGGYEYEMDQTGKLIHVWYLYPDPPRQPMRVDRVAEVLANVFTNRDIVLVICNASGDREEVGVLKVPRVWYNPRGVVWGAPSGILDSGKNHKKWPEGTDSIWSFVTYDGRELPTTQPGK